MTNFQKCQVFLIGCSSVVQRVVNAKYSTVIEPNHMYVRFDELSHRESMILIGDEEKVTETYSGWISRWVTILGKTVTFIGCSDLPGYHSEFRLGGCDFIVTEEQIQMGIIDTINGLHLLRRSIEENVDLYAKASFPSFWNDQLDQYSLQWQDHNPVLAARVAALKQDILYG
jgi:hypothetical protein